MFYKNISESKEPKRTAQKLIELKHALINDGIPKKCNEHALLATWNIREFDSTAYGERDYEPLYYITEICSQFDIIALQEIREDLKALKKLRNILGGYWDYIVTDVTEGRPGNRERMAYLFDSRKVSFSGIAGEIVIPPGQEKVKGKKIIYKPSDQLYRTPYLCGFQVGWTKLMLCTVHIRYGEDDPNDPKRVAEIKALADFLAKRARERKDYSNLVLLGDFNIFSPEDSTMQALTDAGFKIPESLQSVPATNTGKKKRHYDQIASMPKRFNLEFTGKAGVFNLFNTVYKDDEEALYVKAMGDAYNSTSAGKKRTNKNKSTYYKTYWRTHQMSDHLPMWIQFRTDFSTEYIRDKWID